MTCILHKFRVLVPVLKEQRQLYSCGTMRLPSMFIAVIQSRGSHILGEATSTTRAFKPETLTSHSIKSIKSLLNSTC